MQFLFVFAFKMFLSFRNRIKILQRFHARIHLPRCRIFHKITSTMDSLMNCLIQSHTVRTIDCITDRFSDKKYLDRLRNIDNCAGGTHRKAIMLGFTANADSFHDSNFFWYYEKKNRKFYFIEKVLSYSNKSWIDSIKVKLTIIMEVCLTCNCFFCWICDWYSGYCLWLFRSKWPYTKTWTSTRISAWFLSGCLILFFLVPTIVPTLIVSFYSILFFFVQ